MKAEGKPAGDGATAVAVDGKGVYGVDPDRLFRINEVSRRAAGGRGPVRWVERVGGGVDDLWVVSTILGASLKEEREEGGYVEGIAIWVAVFVVSLVGAVNDYQKDQQFRKLNEQKEMFEVTVIRGGKEGLVLNTELVVGDVLILNTGDKVTADGVVFASNDLVIDEASLTGESEPIKKQIDKKPWCRSGTQVTEGSGKILIIAVGENSEWGKTLSLVAVESDETPLQEKLGELAAAIGKLGLVVAVLSFIVLLISAKPTCIVLKFHAFAPCECNTAFDSVDNKYTGSVPEPSEVTAEVKKELEMNFALNSKAFLIEDDPKNIQFIGNRTECALLMLGKAWGSDYKKLRDTFENDYVKIYGFSSAKKMASILVRKGDVLRLYNKGAAEIVVDRCISYHDTTGKVVSLEAAKKAEILSYVTEMASQGLRTIALAYTDFPAEDASRASNFFDNAPDENLILMAVVGIKDPVRKEVPGAVATCQKAGIVVRMVTGDNVHTAQHIAKECGILTDGGVALEGPQFRTMPEEELIKMLPKLQVLARSSPTDKHLLVSTLRKMGEVVAVTGDGTNDAPALKESDVGLAMGIAGTEVAKEAADIVILDDNFLSIVKSVLWGRSVFNNIRKFLQFQLTINFVALILAFTAAIVGGETPLTVLQLLWVNLIMDTMAALALATEHPTWDLLDSMPYGREEPLINSKMWKHIFLGGLYQLFWLLLLLYGMPKHFDRYREPKEEEVWFEWCEDHDEFRGKSTAELCFAENGVLECSRELEECHENKDFVREEEVDKAFFEELEDEFEDAEDDHFMRISSVIFNTFIFMQVFNEVNSRKIADEYNFVSGIFTSKIFVGVLVVTVVLQIIIMTTPFGDFFRVNTLTWYEWVLTVGIGAGTVPWSLAIRIVSRMGCSSAPSPEPKQGV
eukprot:evm.model.scf_144.7 EVM.evm.TU.scf_144.7   scf_144:78288-87675(-)